jgi:hypothetical protein
MGDLLEVGTEVYVEGRDLEYEGRVVGHGRRQGFGGEMYDVLVVDLHAPLLQAGAGRDYIKTIVAHPDCVRARGAAMIYATPRRR